MKTKALNKTTSDNISYKTYIVPEFASAYKMKIQDAFFYLKKYGARTFLNQHWKALHTADPFYTVDYLYRICYQNGGLR